VHGSNEWRSPSTQGEECEPPASRARGGWRERFRSEGAVLDADSSDGGLDHRPTRAAPGLGQSLMAAPRRRYRIGAGELQRVSSE